MTLHSAFSRRAGYALAAALTLVLVACGGGGGGGEGGFVPVIPASSSTPPASTPEPSPPPPTYAVSGTVTGLLGTGLVLQNNAGDDLPIAANGRFSFATQLAGGTRYACRSSHSRRS